MTATSPIQTTRHGLSTAGALLLTVAGNILVVVIVGVALAAVAAAAAVVFGAGVLESL
ncbi:hypothetical protein MK786_12630 [Microbacterium sp. CFH 31415]|uniref:hypothetical protein n=1 Tax=Microbacterium sp. CFH 31415 TaxID=2921732 RepID=UPI001F130E93|nr:hypothetical protein [Microbacterium sp. CFH 31415]MCH6231588.1 hypothetical protein [Microbacterium sp. CFH 31415]